MKVIKFPKKKKELTVGVIAGTNIICMGVILWAFTDWDVIEVVFGAFVFYGLLLGAISLVYDFFERKRDRVRREAKLRRERFKTYQLQSELVQEPCDGDPDLIEWREAWKAVRDESKAI